MKRRRPKPKPRCKFGQFKILPRKIIGGWNAIKEMSGHQPVDVDDIKRRQRKGRL